MSVPSLSTPFNNYARHVTAKLRSRMHAQSFSAVVTDARRRRLTPSGKFATQRVDELKGLVDTHKRTFDANATARAREIFSTLPLLSSDEDPHFATSIRALRYAAYFQLASAPVTFALLDHLVQHAHFLDGYNVYSLCEALVELQCPQTKDALEILQPRILELLTGTRHGEKMDLTAHEAAFILRALAQYDALDAATTSAAATIMIRTGSDVPIQDVCGLLNTWMRLVRHCCQSAVVQDKALVEAVTFQAQAFLTSTEAAIRQLLQEGRAVRASSASNGKPDARDNATADDAAELVQALQQHRQLVREVVKLADALQWAPRRLLAELSRSVVAWSAPQPGPSASTFAAAPPPTPSLTRRDLAVFLRMLSHTSFRDNRALCLAASRLATSHLDAEDGQTPSMVSLSPSSSSSRAKLRALTDYADALEALAFFSQVTAVDIAGALLSRSAGVAAELTSDAYSATVSPGLVLAQVTRLLDGLARLQYTRYVRVATTEETLAAIISPLQILVTCPALPRLLSSRSRQASLSGESAVLAARFVAALAQCTAMLASSAAVVSTSGTAAGSTPLASAALQTACKSQLVCALTALKAFVASASSTELPTARAEVLSCMGSTVSTLEPVLNACPSDAEEDQQLKSLLASL